MNFANPWHKEFTENKRQLSQNLMLLHPHMRRVLDTCQRYFGSIWLTDGNKLR